MSAPFFQNQNSDPFFPALMIHAWISIARMTDFSHRRLFWAHSSVFLKKIKILIYFLLLRMIHAWLSFVWKSGIF